MWRIVLVASLLAGAMCCGMTAAAEEPAGNAAIAADGWVLTYEYLAPTVAADETPAPAEQPDALAATVQAWAAELALPLQVRLAHKWNDPPQQADPSWQSYAQLDRAGRGSVELAGYETRYYELTLSGVTDEAQSDLLARLTMLPGVSPPVQREYSRKYHYLGPHWRELLGCTVTLNGIEYAYPGEFSDLDARALRWQYDSLDPGDSLFIAFREKDPANVAPKRLEQLGDVFKVERLEHGLALTTVQEVWNEGRALLASSPTARLNFNVNWRIELPADAPVAGVDPLLALASRYDSSLRFTDQTLNPIHTQFVYTLFAAGRFVAAGSDKPRAEELEASKALIGAAEAALKDYRSKHPACWNERLYEWRARSFMTRSFGGVPLELHLNVQDANGATARALREHLAQAVPGLPQPQEKVTNVLEQRRQNELDPPDPFAKDDFKIPPLPPPNPDEWCAYSGQRLDYAVFGWSADQAGRYGNSPQLTVALAEIAAWATRQGLTLNPQPDAPRGVAGLAQPSTQPRVFIGDANMAGGNGRFIKHICSVYLAGPDDALAQSLSAALAELPGVTPLKVKPCTFYFHTAHPSEPLEGSDLVLDGKRYSFPGDFCWEEANAVRYLAPPLGSAYYKAFGTLVMPDRNRIALPEVARIVRVEDGSIEISTYKAAWPEGRALYNPPPNVSGGVQVYIPDETKVSDVEIMAQLEAQARVQNSLYDRKEPGKYHFTLFYTLAPPERWLELAKTPVPPSAEAPGRQFAAQIEAKLQPWLDAHPQYMATDTADSTVWWYCHTEGELTLGVQVSARSDTDELINELAALLRDIPGLPEPERRQEANWRYDSSAD